MDFSSLNPSTSNALNIAARNDDVKTVKRLLKKINPNCIDNRGWTCLHEAAYNDAYDSVMVILKHPACRPLAETHEGHTALYLACRNKCSLRTIKLLLDNVDDIANYGSTEGVTPLHVVSGQGRVEVIQLLIDYGAIIDVQDFDGDTPLHDAVLEMQPEAVSVLLHAGANPDIQNDPGFYTPFHLACYGGCFEIVKIIYPFVSDINKVTRAGCTALMLALGGGMGSDFIDFLLDSGADPNMEDVEGEMAVDIALNHGYVDLFEKVFAVTKMDAINKNIVVRACKAHFFKEKILEILLNSELGPEYFTVYDTHYADIEEIGGLSRSYRFVSPLTWFLNISSYIYESSPAKFREFLYLFLMHGVRVNAERKNECPPLVYINLFKHTACFQDIFEILLQYGINVDYCSQRGCKHKDRCIPDVFLAVLSGDSRNLVAMIPYTLCCDPGILLQFAHDNGVLDRMPPNIQNELVTMIDSNLHIKPELLPFYVPSLKHLARFKIRRIIRNRKTPVKSTEHFLNIINSLPLPPIMRAYLRYT